MTVVEDRPIMSIRYCLPVPVFYFWRKLQRTLQRGLSAIAEHLVVYSLGCEFGCQYQCNRLPGKTRLRHDAYCVSSGTFNSTH